MAFDGIALGLFILHALMLKIVRCFFCFLLLYFVVQTFLVYGLGWSDGRSMLMLGKDILWWVIVLGVVIRGVIRRQGQSSKGKGTWGKDMTEQSGWERGGFISFFGQYKYLLFCVIFLLLLSLVLGVQGGMSWKMILVGIKYDCYPLLLVLSGMWLGQNMGSRVDPERIWTPPNVFGASLKQSLKTVGMKSEGGRIDGGWGMKKFVHWLWWMVVVVVCVGVLWQFAKWLWPDFFINFLGYGPLGDFAPWRHPPLYYLTGSGGIVRLSGLFAGPNVFGFFLVGFAGLFLHGLRQYSGFWRSLGVISYSLIVLLTLSRGAVVAYGLVCLGYLFLVDGHRSEQGVVRFGLLSLKSFAGWRKRFLFGGIIVVFMFLFVWKISSFKSGSNEERVSGQRASLSLMREQPWGMGPGFVGPARHYWADYQGDEKHSYSLLENIYVQVGVNLGVLGLLVWLLFWGIIFWMIFEKWWLMSGGGKRMADVSESEKEHWEVLMVLSLGLGALLIEGMVLHVWIDSMVNYVFLVTLGIIFAYVEGSAIRPPMKSDEVKSDEEWRSEFWIATSQKSSSQGQGGIYDEVMIMNRWLIVILKVLLAGLAFHFFFDTLLQWGWGWDRGVLALWKEIVIVGLGVAASYMLVVRGKVKYEKGVLDTSCVIKNRLCMTRWFWFLILFLFLFVTWSAFVSFVIHDVSVYSWMLAMKYDVFPLLVFVSIFLAWKVWGREEKTRASSSKLLGFFVKLVKVLLGFSLLWYVIVNVAPDLLTVFGYQMNGFQWVAGQAPPVRYLTNVWWGFVRNQGLFGGPVSWGFYLIVFWPLFVVWHTIKNKMNITTTIRLMLYVVDVIITFSRASWGVFVLETMVLVAMMIYWYRQQGLKQMRPLLIFLTSIGLGVLATIVFLSWMGPAPVVNVEKHQTTILTRELSDKGHREGIRDGLALIKDHWLMGLGAGSVGSIAVNTSEKGFHPENNYIAIAVSYGIIGLVIWLLCWMLVLGPLGMRPKDENEYIHIALALGLGGVAVAGMVLHPFVDSQVMYSLMVLMGVVGARY